MAGFSDLYMKDGEQERVEREKVEGRESGRRKCGNERVGDRCGLSKEINFSTSRRALCAGLLMTKMRGNGKKGQDDQGLYIHTSLRSHICPVRAGRSALLLHLW